MASFTSTTVGTPRLSSGHSGVLPPLISGDRDHPDSPPDYRTRLRRARLGLMVALTPIFMLFVSFTSAYLVRQGLPSLDPNTNKLVSDWIPVKLPLLLFFNTCILLLSSICIEFARRRAKSGVVGESHAASSLVSGKNTDSLPWLPITLILGLSFLYGQWLAWRQLAASGFYVTTAPSSSFVYLLTGAHAVHLFGGILALLAACLASFLRFSLIRRSIVVDVTAWYWHFMTVLWVYILCLLEFAR